MENPVISRIVDLQKEAHLSSEHATYSGVAWKELMLLALVVASASVSVVTGYATPIVTIVACVATIIMAIIIGFFPKAASFLSPLFAIFEGMMIAFLSMTAETMFPNIVLQAVALTIGVAVASAFIFSKGLVKVDSRFVQIVSVALFGLMFCYLGEFILGYFFHVDFGFLQTGIVGLVIDIAIIGLATACLFIDYHEIKETVEMGLPKEYEWLCAFSLLVTLVWLYVRILELLMRLRSDD